MSVGRVSHTATLLGNGFVFVAGGYGNSLLASAELFATPDFAGSPAPAVDAGGDRIPSLNNVGVATLTLTGIAQSPSSLMPLSYNWLSGESVLAAAKTMTVGPFGLANLGTSSYTFQATDARGVFAFQTISVYELVGSIVAELTPPRNRDHNRNDRDHDDQERDDHGRRVRFDVFRKQ